MEKIFWEFLFEKKYFVDRYGEIHQKKQKDCLGYKMYSLKQQKV